jgi:RNA polymerase sigma factor (TIGR02999 family)
MQLRNRAHFYGAAAQVMRRVLVDHARQRRSLKRGGSADIVPLEEVPDMPLDTPVDVVALHEALEALEQIAPEKGRVVELRYFAGLSVEEAADYLNIAPVTVKRHWAFARAWLLKELNAGLVPRRAE